MIGDVCDEIADHTVLARISPNTDNAVVFIAKITCRGRNFQIGHAPVTGDRAKTRYGLIQVDTVAGALAA
jgi:hypothetical protein